MRFDTKQPGRRVRAGVAGAAAILVGFVAGKHIDGDAGIDAAVCAFNQIEIPRLGLAHVALIERITIVSL